MTESQQAVFRDLFARLTLDEQKAYVEKLKAAVLDFRTSQMQQSAD